MTRPDLYAAIYRAKRVAMELDCDHSQAALVFAALDRMEKAFRAEVDFAALCRLHLTNAPLKTTLDEVTL